MRYWLSIGDGKTLGPFTREELSTMQSQGRLGPAPQLCPEGMQQWVPASSVLDAPLHPPTSVPPPVVGQRDSQYAGFGTRWAAAFLDGLIVGATNWLVGFVIGGVLVSSGLRDTGAISAIGFLADIAVAVAYSAGLESSAWQATLGKRAANIKVTDLAGGRISFGQGVGRYFGKFLSTIILCFGYLMVLWDPRKQALHDRLAGTLVVKR